MTTSIRSDPVGTVCEDMVKELASAAKVDTEPAWATSANAVPDPSGKAMPTAIAAMATAHTNSRSSAFGIYWLILRPDSIGVATESDLSKGPSAEGWFDKLTTNGLNDTYHNNNWWK